MIATDEKALICDLAEVYHVYNYKSLPASLVAAFSVGLRDDSRIKMKMNDMRFSLSDILLAGISDKLSLMLWMQTEDGVKGVNRPVSIVAKLLGKEEEKENDIISFDTPEAFDRAWISIVRGGEK